MNNEDINLIDIVKTIRKNIKLIFILCLIGVAIAIAQNYLLLKQYQAEAIVQIGIINDKQIETADSVAQKMNAIFSKKYSNFKASIIEGSNSVVIKNYSTNALDAEVPVKESVSNILADHKSVIEAEKNRLAGRLKDSLNNLQAREQRLLQMGEQIVPLEIIAFNLESSANNFVESKVVEAPTVLPKKDFNIFIKVIIGGILGILIGLISIFARSWWQKNKLNF